MIRSKWLLVALSCFPSALIAQGGEWPTLSGAGIEYLSQSGFLQVSLSGQLDLETLHVRESWSGLVAREEGEAPLPGRVCEPCAVCHVGMGLRGDGGALPVYRLRMFADIFLGDHIYSLIEGRSDRGHAPSDGGAVARVEQAYVRIASQSGSAGVQAGRFASPFGSYSLRHLTTVDPFLRPPLSYDYRTVMSREVVPADAALLQEWKHATEFFRKPGAPPVLGCPLSVGCDGLRGGWADRSSCGGDEQCSLERPRGVGLRRGEAGGPLLGDRGQGTTLTLSRPGLLLQSRPVDGGAHGRNHRAVTGRTCRR